MSQPEFLYEIFEDFLDSPENKEFTLDNGLVCRWMTGQAKISPKISSFYARPSNQEKLAKTIHQNIVPLMADCDKALQDIYTLFIHDSSISEAKKSRAYLSIQTCQFTSAVSGKANFFWYGTPVY